MRRYSSLLLLLFTAGLLRAEVVYEIDFARMVPFVEAKSPRFQGVLPEGWKLQSGAAAGKAGKGVYSVTLREEKGVKISIPVPLKYRSCYRISVDFERSPEGRNGSGLLLLQTEKPQVKLGQLRLEADAGRQRLSTIVLVNSPFKEAEIQLRLSDPVEFRFHSIRVEEVAPGTPAREVRLPAADSVNYFRNSRLPLGLQSGWVSGRDIGEVRLSEKPGPSGYPHLILDYPERVSEAEGNVSHGIFDTEPFNPSDFTRTHYVSFSYRGSGDWTARIMGFRMQTPKKLPPTKEWRRVTVPFTPDAAAYGHLLRFYGSGELEIDAFRASSSLDDRYLPQNECEVALALPDSAAAAARIQFEDEKPLVRYLVTGEANGVEVEAKAFDLYGGEFQLTAEAGIIDFGAAVKDKPFGQFRVEVLAKRDGKTVSPPNEIVVTRLPLPKFRGKDAPESYFGGFPASDLDMLALKAGGVNHARFHDHGGLPLVGWYYLEPEPGKWLFRDDRIARYRKHHFHILGELGTTPGWASLNAGGETGPRAKWLRPRDPKEFAGYVRTVAGRYRNEIREWGLGNEPWGAFFFDRYAPKEKGTNRFGYLPGKVEDFALLQKTMHETLKAVDPGIRSAGISASWAFPNWAEKMYGLGGLNTCDVIELHQYTAAWTGFSGDAVDSGVRLALGSKVPRGKTVWNTEGQGVFSSQFGGFGDLQTGIYHWTLPFKDTHPWRMTADRQTRFLVSNLGSGVGRVYQYACPSGWNRGLAIAAQWTVLLQGDGYAHPQLVAHAALAKRIDAVPFHSRFEAAPGVWVFLFGNEKGSTAVVIPRRGVSGWKLHPANAAAADLWGNPLPLPVADHDTLFYLESGQSPALFAEILKKK